MRYGWIVWTMLFFTPVAIAVGLQRIHIDYRNPDNIASEFENVYTFSQPRFSIKTDTPTTSDFNEGDVVFVSTPTSNYKAMFFKFGNDLYYVRATKW